MFTCISMLGRALGPTIQAPVKQLIEPMLAVGLSPSLTAALRDLATQIPGLKKNIQVSLLLARPLPQSSPHQFEINLMSD